MDPHFEWGDALPELRGKRIRLRPVHDADAPAILAVFGDPEVMRYWSTAPMPDLDAARALIDEIRENFARRSLFQWAISRLEAPELIGTCTLFNLDRRHRRAEIGYALRRDVWGQGLAGDALATLIAFSFDTLGLHRLEADADPDNARSLRTLERQGFRREGYLRERWHHLGALHDAVFLGLLRSEWTGRDEPR
jgi:[ribosomal protein S5]-alanine N-acetyltransferase